MRKIIKKEDVIGSYENIDVVLCGNCNQEVHLVQRLVSMEELERTKSWHCPECGDEENYTVDIAVRFKCPDCGKVNIQIKEPSSVEYKEYARFRCYLPNTEAICISCNSGFGIAVIADDLDGDPNTWRKALYRTTT